MLSLRGDLGDGSVDVILHPVPITDYPYQSANAPPTRIARVYPLWASRSGWLWR
jgi:hypothetical protein